MPEFNVRVPGSLIKPRGTAGLLFRQVSDIQTRVDVGASIREIHAVGAPTGNFVSLEDAVAAAKLASDGDAPGVAIVKTASGFGLQGAVEAHQNFITWSTFEKPLHKIDFSVSPLAVKAAFEFPHTTAIASDLVALVDAATVLVPKGGLNAFYNGRFLNGTATKFVPIGGTSRQTF